MSNALRQFVRERAGGRCEYCRFREEHLALWPFHADHIIARQHGGPDEATNRAWSCYRCNLQKGPNLSALDPDSNVVVRLFDPRANRWNEHFVMHAGRITGLTPTGRATAWLLEMNTEERIQLRKLLMEDGLW